MKQFLLNVVLFQDKEHRTLSYAFWIMMLILSGIIVCGYFAIRYSQTGGIGYRIAVSGFQTLPAALGVALAVFLHLSFEKISKNGTSKN